MNSFSVQDISFLSSLKKCEEELIFKVLFNNNLKVDLKVLCDSIYPKTILYFFKFKNIVAEEKKFSE